MPKATQQAVFSAIKDERVFQDRKWGTIEEHPHEVGSWLTILDQLLEDAKRGWMSTRGDEAALDEIRKIAAVSMACMEQHGIVHRKPIDFAEQSPHFSVSKAEEGDRTIVTHYGLFRSSAPNSPGIKEAGFFISQGGKTQDWGKSWEPIHNATSIGDARRKFAAEKGVELSTIYLNEK